MTKKTDKDFRIVEQVVNAQLAERDAEIVELNRRFNAQSDNFVAASITIGQLRAEIAQLKAQVAELQANNAEDWHGRTGHDVM